MRQILCNVAICALGVLVISQERYCDRRIDMKILKMIVVDSNLE